jgi:hypothetical protein
MKAIHLYEVKLLDGTQYRGEITYRNDEKIVLKPFMSAEKLVIFNNSIASIREIGWKKI